MIDSRGKRFIYENMETREWDNHWMEDNYDATDKKIDVWYWYENKWHNCHISITTNDGMVQWSDTKNTWELPIIPVNMKQVRERVDMFIHADLPCFGNIKPKAFFVTMREDIMDENFVELALLW